MGRVFVYELSNSRAQVWLHTSRATKPAPVRWFMSKPMAPGVVLTKRKTGRILNGRTYNDTPAR